MLTKIHLHIPNEAKNDDSLAIYVDRKKHAQALINAKLPQTALEPTPLVQCSTN